MMTPGHRAHRPGAQHLSGVCPRRVDREPAGQVWFVQGDGDPHLHDADPAGPAVPPRPRHHAPRHQGTAVAGRCRGQWRGWGQGSMVLMLGGGARVTPGRAECKNMRARTGWARSLLNEPGAGVAGAVSAGRQHPGGEQRAGEARRLRGLQEDRDPGHHGCARAGRRQGLQGRGPGGRCRGEARSTAAAVGRALLACASPYTRSRMILPLPRCCIVYTAAHHPAAAAACRCRVQSRGSRASRGRRTGWRPR